MYFTTWCIFYSNSVVTTPTSFFSRPCRWKKAVVGRDLDWVIFRTLEDQEPSSHPVFTLLETPGKVEIVTPCRFLVNDRWNLIKYLRGKYK